MFCHGFKTIWYTYSKEFVYLPDENCASTEWRRLQNFNDQAYALTPFMPHESSFITLPLFLKTTPFNKFIYSKTFDLAWVSIISLSLFSMGMFSFTTNSKKFHALYV